jgi:hypothetical protein
MMSKRFLISVMVFAGLSLPAGADVLAYCDGGGCGTNTSAAFNAIVTTPTYTYASVGDLTFTGMLTSSTEYDDATTFTQFLDVTSGGAFTINGADALDTKAGNGDVVTINVPATYSVLVVSISSINGPGAFCLDGGCDYTNANTPTFVGYINSGSGAWSVTISKLTGSPQLAISGFDLASLTADSGGGPGGGDSDTPEVATMILIGSGLIGMRMMRRVPQRLLRHFQPA